MRLRNYVQHGPEEVLLLLFNRGSPITIITIITIIIIIISITINITIKHYTYYSRGPPEGGRRGGARHGHQLAALRPAGVQVRQHIYVYIYIERDMRNTYIYIYTQYKLTHIYIYIYIYIK